MDNNARDIMANYNNRFDKIRDRIDRRAPSKKKVKQVNNENGNTFMSEAYPIIIICCIIACFGVFYFIFNSYKKVLVVENDGYFIDTRTLI
jgi:hypothetical protein